MNTWIKWKFYIFLPIIFPYLISLTNSIDFNRQDTKAEVAYIEIFWISVTNYNNTVQNKRKMFCRNIENSLNKKFSSVFDWIDNKWIY